MISHDTRAAMGRRHSLKITKWKCVRCNKSQELMLLKREDYYKPHNCMCNRCHKMNKVSHQPKTFDLRPFERKYGKIQWV